MKHRLTFEIEPFKIQPDFEAECTDGDGQNNFFGGMETSDSEFDISGDAGETCWHWPCGRHSKGCPAYLGEQEFPRKLDLNTELDDFEWEDETNRNSQVYVRWVQRSLNKALGPRLAEDGIMGAQTRSAIRDFQRRRGLTVDGKVGPQTESALKSVGGKLPTGEPMTPPVSDMLHGASARLQGFDFDRSDLKQSHFAQIDVVADKIVKSWQSGKPLFTVKVVGHTDPEGATQHNQALGLRRALSVRRELQKALKRKQPDLYYKVLVLASSKGESEPIDDTHSPRGNVRNRRVEVFLSTKALLPKEPSVFTLPTQVIHGSATPTPRSQPPNISPSCNKTEWKRLIDECIASAEYCTLNNCSKRLAIELAACRLDPICTAAATAKYWHCLGMCRDTLNRCKDNAERSSKCREGDWKR